MNMKKALLKIVSLIEHWADNPRERHEEVLCKILSTALGALKRE